MAKIRVMRYSFDPSQAPDVVGYKLYYCDAGAGLSYDSPSVDLGKPDPELDGKIRVDLVALGIFTQDQSYDFGVVAIDDVGNESSMLKEMGVPFDLVAPDAPTNGLVERETQTM